MGQNLDLPLRKGEAPQVAGYVPHQQIDQHSDVEVFEAFKALASELPDVSLIKSRTTVDNSVGLYLEPGVKIHPKAEREFAHLNVEPKPGSFHVKLPTEDVDYIVSKGWGVYHPMSEVVQGRSGQIAVALIYAPRDSDELKVAMQILTYAHRFATTIPNKKSVFTLIGFMGSGKTSIGKRLASILDMSFIDLDDYIEQEEGISINQIFTGQGESVFRLLETHYLSAIIDQHDQLILAAGGGTPCYERNWSALNKSYTIYIERTNKYLYKNLHKKKEKRPLIRSLSDYALKNLITEKMKIRSPYYCRADVRYLAEGSKDNIAKDLTKKVKKKLKKIKK